MNAKLISAAIALFMLLSLYGCSGKSRLLDTIPADAPGVLTVNVKHLIEAMDGTKNGGKLTATETLDKFLSNSSERCHQEITTILTSESIERDLMAGFAIGTNNIGVNAFTHPGEYVYTFKIKHLDNLIKEIGASPQPTRIEEFDVYALEDVNLIVRERQGWIMWGDPSKAVSKLAAELNRANNTSVASIKGIAKFLESDDDILHLAIARSTATDGWTCITGNVDNNEREIELKAKLINADGKETDMDSYLKKIDTSLLDYTMPSDLFVMAIGIPGDTDWDALLGYTQSIYPLDYRQRALVGMALPYLKRLDGSIMVAMGIDNDKELTSANMVNNISFVVAIQLKKGEIKKTLGDISDIISMLGLPIVDKGNEFVMQSPGMAPVTLKAVDNAIILTNRPLKQLGNNAARTLAKGNAFALWTSIPNSIGEAVYGGKGFNVAIEIEDNFEMAFSFADPSLPIFEQLAALIPAGNDVPQDAPEVTEQDNMGFTPIDTIR